MQQAVTLCLHIVHYLLQVVPTPRAGVLAPLMCWVASRWQLQTGAVLGMDDVQVSCPLRCLSPWPQLQCCKVQGPAEDLLATGP